MTVATVTSTIGIIIGILFLVIAASSLILGLMGVGSDSAGVFSGLICWFGLTGAIVTMVVTNIILILALGVGKIYSAVSKK